MKSNHLVFTGVRLERAELELLKLRAREEHRSVASLVRHVLAQFVRGKLVEVKDEQTETVLQGS